MAGNFWNTREVAGINTPEDLRASAIEYFDWAHDAPLSEAKAFAYQGSSWVESLDKARVFTIKGLAVFIGVPSTELEALRSNAAFVSVMQWIDDVIYTQKFELGAADLVNATMISKDLGLVDKKSVEGGFIVQIGSDDADL